MAEIPGMTRPALDAMTTTDVVKVRWSLYARTLAPLVREDYDKALADLADQEKPPSRTTQATRRGEARERLTMARIEQARIRELLYLDG